MRSKQSKDDVALNVKRNRLKRAQQAQLLEATEKVQSALLSSVAHDLRTPLVSIQGALSFLQEDAIHLDDATRQSLIENAVEEADRLNRFIGNLLDMARVEAGAIPVVLEPYDVEEVIGSVLERMSYLLKDRDVEVRVPPALPLVPMDCILIGQALVNLLDNAIRYSAPGTPIEVSAQRVGAHLEIAVADRGIGIPPDDLRRVFGKFYRVPRPDGGPGTGLGLAICKGIVQAHGGSIAAENRDGGGAVVRLRLPLAE